MKKLFLAVIVSFLMPPLFTTAYEKGRTEKEEKIQLVLASCFGIIQNAILIGQNPHNKQNVGENVGHIMHNIAEVVTQATKQLNISPEEFMEMCHRRMLVE